MLALCQSRLKFDCDLRQGDNVFGTIWQKNYCPDTHETWWKGAQWAMEEPIKSWSEW